MSQYIVLKPETVSAIDQLKDFTYFIVHTEEEFKVFDWRYFFQEYRDFDHIIDLCCIAPGEELRYNSQNWLRIFESDHEGHTAECLKILHQEVKSFILHHHENTGRDIVVYKYFIRPDFVPYGPKEKEIALLQEMPIIYRHGIAPVQ